MISLRFPIICLLMILMTACAASSRSGVYHTVQKGQTLYTISRVYDVDETYLARINGVADPTQLQSGERIYIPGATQIKQVPITVKPAPPPTPKKTIVASVPKPAPVQKKVITKIKYKIMREPNK